jgi:CheY-like chemotaxis protein
MTQAAKIVVVDDDLDFLEYTRIVLESQGYQVRTADTSDAAMTMVRSDKPDIILLDVMMSYVLDGINISRQLRDDPELRDIPVIMISAIVSRDEAGFFPTNEPLPVDAFLSKPVDPADLLSHVARLLADRNADH